MRKKKENDVKPVNEQIQDKLTSITSIFTTAVQQLRELSVTTASAITSKREVIDNAQKEIGDLEESLRQITQVKDNLAKIVEVDPDD